MAHIRSDNRVVFDGGEPGSKPDSLKDTSGRPVDLLGEAARASYGELLRLVDMLFTEGAASGLDEVSMNLGVETDARFSLFSVAEGGILGEAGLTLSFRRS